MHGGFTGQPRASLKDRHRAIKDGRKLSTDRLVPYFSTPIVSMEGLRLAADTDSEKADTEGRTQTVYTYKDGADSGMKACGKFKNLVSKFKAFQKSQESIDSEESEKREILS